MKLEKAKVEHLIKEISKVIKESNLNKHDENYRKLLSILETLVEMKGNLEMEELT